MAIPKDYFEWAARLFDPARIHEKPEAPRAIRDLDLSVIFGPATADFLGELGAEVIKVEPPGGDPARRWGPADAPVNGEGLAFLAEARNRYHMTLDLEKKEGRKILRGQAERADVLVEGFAPGYLDGLGLGYRSLSRVNPRLVHSLHGGRNPGQGAGRPRSRHRGLRADEPAHAHAHRGSLVGAGLFQARAGPDLRRIALADARLADDADAAPAQVALPSGGYHNGHVLQKYLGCGPRRLAELARDAIV